MEEKLEQYRKVRNKKNLSHIFGNKLKNLGSSCIDNLKQVFFSKESDFDTLRISDISNKTNSQNLSDDEDNIQNEWSGRRLLVKLQLIILWIAGYVFFIKVEFGAVYFAISLLCFIYYNTRTGKRKANEVSAYSVFNEGCIPIDGTIDPQQFEKEIRGGFF